MKRGWPCVLCMQLARNRFSLGLPKNRVAPFIRHGIQFCPVHVRLWDQRSIFKTYFAFSWQRASVPVTKAHCQSQLQPRMHNYLAAAATLSILALTSIFVFKSPVSPQRQRCSLRGSCPGLSFPSLRPSPRAPTPNLLIATHARNVDVAASQGCYHTITFAIPNAIVGGFGDRLKGLVTAYSLALATKSGFRVEWRHPYDLETFFHLPHALPSNASAVNWTARPPAKVSHIIDRQPTFDGDYMLPNLLACNSGADLRLHTNIRLWQGVLARPEVQSTVAHLGLVGLAETQQFRVMVNALFSRPRLRLKDAVNQLQDALGPAGTRYAGVQIRTGGDGTLFQDPARHPIDSARCFAAKAAELVANGTVKAVYLTSDLADATVAFGQAWQQLFQGHPVPPRIVQAPGAILHIDRSDTQQLGLDIDTAQAAWLKSVADWWMLRGAHAHVVSQSGFGMTAAWASQAPYYFKLNETRGQCAFDMMHVA